MTRLTPQRFLPVVALAALLGGCSATADVDETEPGLEFRELHSLSNRARASVRERLEALSGRSMSPEWKAYELSLAYEVEYATVLERYEIVWCRPDRPLRERGSLFLESSLIDPEDPTVEYMAVSPLAAFSGDDLLPESIQATLDSRGKPAIRYAMKAEAASDYADWTGSHIGEPLAIVIGHELLSAPILQGRISGTGLISGDFSSTEIEALVQSLRTAASRAP